MPNGTVAPGKVCPSGPVPISGSTSLRGSRTWARAIVAASSTAKLSHFFMTPHYSNIYLPGPSDWARCQLCRPLNSASTWAQGSDDVICVHDSPVCESNLSFDLGLWYEAGGHCRILRARGFPVDVPPP